MKKLAVISVLALGALGALAAVGIGSSGSAPTVRTFEAVYEDPNASLKQVLVPRAGATAAAKAIASGKRKKKKKGRPQINYFETEPVAIEPGEALGGAFKCPKRNKVLNGYFSSDGTDAALTLSAPVSRRGWFIGVTHLDGVGGATASAVAFGIICAQGVR